MNVKFFPLPANLENTFFLDFLSFSADDNSRNQSSLNQSSLNGGDNGDMPGRLRSKLLSFAYNFIAGILVLAFVGYKLDEYLENDNHLYLLIGIFLGFFWSMYETFKLVRFLNRK